MKKNRVLSFFLTLTLVLGLAAPAAAVSSVDEFHVDAKAAILVDTAHGEVLFEQNAHEKLYPASITKVMTALLTIEALEQGKLTLDQPITASNVVNDKMISGASTQDIKVGEVMPLRDVLACALIPSANEACNILAETVGGSVTGFVDLMNERAAQLGCENTHFANPHGLHDDNHYTTAWDIYLISNEAMKYPLFREMVTSKSYTVAPTNLAPQRVLHDTNALISNHNKTGYLYQYATGIKTGYTPEAGYCLASSATKGDRSLIAVVLGCERVPGTTGSVGFTYFTETQRLLEFGFNNFSRRSILNGTHPMETVPVTLSEEADQVVAEPKGDISATLPNDWDVADFQLDTELLESVTAPVAKGQVLGKVTVSYRDKVYGSLDLVAVDDVARSELLYRLDQIQRFFSQLWVKIVLVVLVLLVLVLVLRFLVFGGRRRSTRRRGYSGRRR